MAITKVTRTLLSTGIVDNSNATAITIDSSENVGIGLTNQANKLQVDGDICIGKATTSADLKSTLKMRGANGSNQLQVFDKKNFAGALYFSYNFVSEGKKADELEYKYLNDISFKQVMKF